MIKEFFKKYILIIVGILLVLSLITATIFGFMWGKQKAQNQAVKEREKIHLESIRVQDSIILEKTKIITILSDSVEKVIISAISQNDKVNKEKEKINKDKQKMNEEINNIPFLDTDSNIRLFNRLTDNYQSE